MEFYSLNKLEDHRMQNGYGGALLIRNTVDNPAQTKYELLIGGETVPFVFGETETVEVDIMQSETKGKIQGKMSIDDKDVDFLLHRDNIYRLEKFANGKMYDFLSVTKDGVAYKCTGTITYKPNDVSGSDAHRGTFRLVCASAEKKPIMDVRELFMDTCLFTDAVDSDLAVDTTGKDILIRSNVSGFSYSVAIKNNAGVSTKFTAAPATGAATGDSATIKIKAAEGATATDYAIAYITISKTGYASWTTTVRLSVSA